MEQDRERMYQNLIRKIWIEGVSPMREEFVEGLLAEEEIRLLRESLETPITSPEVHSEAKGLIEEIEEGLLEERESDLEDGGK